MCPRLYRINPALCSRPAASVTPSRRTPSIALQHSLNTSILNALPAVVEAITAEEHPGLALVRLRLGASPLLARLTRRSVQALELTPGKVVFAQVKAVALVG